MFSQKLVEELRCEDYPTCSCVSCRAADEIIRLDSVATKFVNAEAAGVEAEIRSSADLLGRLQELLAVVPDDYRFPALSGGVKDVLDALTASVCKMCGILSGVERIVGASNYDNETLVDRVAFWHPSSGTPGRNPEHDNIRRQAWAEMTFDLQQLLQKFISRNGSLDLPKNTK